MIALAREIGQSHFGPPNKSLDSAVLQFKPKTIEIFEVDRRLILHNFCISKKHTIDYNSLQPSYSTQYCSRI